MHRQPVSSDSVNDARKKASRPSPSFQILATEPAQAAKRFFSKALAAPHTSTPRVITVAKNAAYPKAFTELKAEEIMPASCELRQSKYLNNLIEQDHRFLKRLVKLGMGFFSFETAWRTRAGAMKR
jgi:transposase, IS6 family